MEVMNVMLLGCNDNHLHHLLVLIASSSSMATPPTAPAATEYRLSYAGPAPPAGASPMLGMVQLLWCWYLSVATDTSI
jgi:hypothetical protein